MPHTQIIHGTTPAALNTFPDEHFTAVITDPPYGLNPAMTPNRIVDIVTKWCNGEDNYVPAKGAGFMGHGWDKFIPPPAAWKAISRKVKPGGWFLVFTSPKCLDLTTLSLRLAGLEVRDTAMWLYSEGFPKGAKIGDKVKEINPNAGDYSGYKVDLKPAYEPIVMARKPTDGSMIHNVAKHGVGALNIDGCRRGETLNCNRINYGKTHGYSGRWREEYLNVYNKPRWPGNAWIDNHLAPQLGNKAPYYTTFIWEGNKARACYGDRPTITKNGKQISHPTTKPLDLMRWLTKLVSPPAGAIILDPFAGSGATIEAAAREGYDAIGIEADETWANLANQRLDTWKNTNQ